MFIARGVEVIVDFTVNTAGAWQSGNIKLKINSRTFICICPDPISPYYTEILLLLIKAVGLCNGPEK